MRRIVIVLLAVFAASGASFAPASAQSSSDIAGRIVDSTGVGLPGATVVLLQASDSLLVSFAATRADGTFRLRRVVSGEYVFQASYVGYATHCQPLTKADEAVDIGAVTLSPQTADLGDLVVLADRIPIVIKKDTLEYDAAAFGAPPGSNVEDLLRRLPGVEVERDGTIKAQGETVERVLVDGEEFFGGDPTIATRNLPADAVDRVQVYDKESDTAEFTGVADGQEQKTLNLSLHEDRRAGYFGNVQGGLGGAQATSAVPGGAESVRFDGSASINRFSPRTQLSFLGNANNVGRQSFSIQDYIRFMGGLSALTSGGGGSVSLSFGGDSGLPPIGDAASQGFATVGSGGINVNHDFSEATDFHASYFGTGLDSRQRRTTRQRELFGSSESAQSARETDQAGTSLSHALRTDVEHELGEGHDVRLRASLRTSGNDGTGQGFSETVGESGLVERDRVSESASDARTWSGSTRLTYRKRLGRVSLVVESFAEFDDRRSDRTDISLNRLFDGGAITLSQALDQLREQHTDTRTLGGSLLLSRPLGRGWALQGSASARRIRETDALDAFDRADDTLARIDAQSRGQARTQRLIEGRVTLRAHTQAHTFSGGAKLQAMDLGTAIYLRPLPFATARMDLGEGRTLTLAYQTATTAPTLRQVQSAPDLRNPLDTYVGTPDLRPEYRHRLSTRYVHFDAFTMASLFATAGISYVPTAIATARTVDDDLRQTSTPINDGEAWTLSGEASYSRPLRPSPFKVSISAQSRYQRGEDRLNGASNAYDLTRSELDLTVENRRKTHFDLRVGVRVALNTAAYSLSPQFDQTYRTTAAYAEGSKRLGAWTFLSSVDVERYPADVFGSARRVPLWDAEIQWNPTSRVRLDLVGADLLNQGLGISYASTGASVQESRVDGLGRYLLLKLVYTLTPTSRSGGGMSISM